MHHEFSAVFERDKDWFVGFCPEVPGANGQGQTLEECRENLAEAITLLLKCRFDDGMRGLPPDAIVETVSVETASIEIPQAA